MPRVHTPSPRIHNRELAEAILALVKERPQRTVPKLRSFSRSIRGWRKASRRYPIA